METIKVQAEPMPCPRPRACVIAGSARVFNPTKYTTWKSALAGLIADARPLTTSHACAIAVSIEIACTRPRTTKLDFPKPDADNYAKAVLDACTQAGVWDDDCQVAHLTVRKRWSPSLPYICIDITELRPLP